ncbi:Zinc finger, CCHC-type, partial [Parasponia andersonii]
MKQTNQLDKACSQKDLLTKCSAHNTCSCTQKRSRKHRHSKESSRFSYNKKKKSRRPWRFLRKKKRFRKTSDRCHICGQKGHFAKQCPKGKMAKMISHIKNATGISLSDNDVESIFSLDEEINPDIVCAIQLPSDSSEWSEQEEIDEQYQITAINTIQPVPTLKMQVLPSKYLKPIKVAAFVDTG